MPTHTRARRHTGTHAHTHTYTQMYYMPLLLTHRPAAGLADWFLISESAYQPRNVRLGQNPAFFFTQIGMDGYLDTGLLYFHSFLCYVFLSEATERRNMETAAQLPGHWRTITSVLVGGALTVWESGGERGASGESHQSAL